MKDLKPKERNEVLWQEYASPIPAKLQIIRTDTNNLEISKEYAYQNQCELGSYEERDDSYEERDDTDETHRVALNRSQPTKKIAVVLKKGRRANQCDLIIDKRTDDTRDCHKEHRLNELCLTTKKLESFQLGKLEDDMKYTTKGAAPRLRQKLIGSGKQKSIIINKAEEVPQQPQEPKNSLTKTHHEGPSAQRRAHPLHPRVMPRATTPGRHHSSRKDPNHISKMDQGVFHRLYANSRPQQQLGQQRRERIEQASRMKKAVPTFKKVSNVEATEILSQIYYRGIMKVERVKRI